MSALNEKDRRPSARAFDDFMGAFLVMRRYAVAVLVAVVCNLVVSLCALYKDVQTASRTDQLEQRVGALEAKR